MPTRATRKLSLLDIMALVAATAAGFAIPRSFSDFSMAYRIFEVDWTTPGPDGATSHGFPTEFYTNRTMSDLYAARWGWKAKFPYWASVIGLWPGPGLAAWTLTTLGLGLRRPRPRRPARRPGTAAGLAVLVAIVATAINHPMILTAFRRSTAGYPHPNWADWQVDFWFALPDAAGLAVVASWTVLASSGRWAAEPSWQDRLGRLLGASWVVIAAIGLASKWRNAFP